MNADLSIQLKRSIAAPAAALYQAFTNATALTGWLCDTATVQPQPGGRIYLAWNDGYYSAGEYLALEADKKVAFSWRGKDEPATIVEISLLDSQGKTELTLTHSKIESEEAREGFLQEWTAALENLDSTCTSGADLRLTRRPMVGIYPNDFNAEIAAKLGVPVDYGTRISAVVEGMGAQAAGLQQDDVIFNLDGRELLQPTDFQAVIRSKKAGDPVLVSFYRGAEKHSVEMTLSGRQFPAVAESGQALAETVKNGYHAVLPELRALLADVTQAEANRAPAEGEWSVMETLAHLVLGERGNFAYIADQYVSQVRWADDWGGNISEPHTALIMVHPTIEDMLAELEEALHETVALLKAMPDSFYANKHAYWVLATQLPQNDGHLRSHMAQMEAAIKAARA